MFDITTETGEIRFSQNVIYTIVDRAVEACEGKVELNNYKSRNKNTVELEEKEGRFDITLYITVKFGTSLKDVTDFILDHIYNDMEHILGSRPSSIKIVVTGIVSRDIARRHLEFTR